jgi:hypothetical protein
MPKPKHKPRRPKLPTLEEQKSDPARVETGKTVTKPKRALTPDRDKRPKRRLTGGS